MDCIRYYESPLGGITLAGNGDALVGLWFDGQAYFGEGLSPERREQPLPVLEEAARWLDIYFDGETPAFTPKLSLRGTPFRQRVWRVMSGIPYGETVTYGELASLAGCSSARAVGGAVGRNPISLIIPCHRVVGAGGALTGYAGGLERKARLLALESRGERGTRA